jgi:hypothetical protein
MEDLSRGRRDHPLRVRAAVNTGEAVIAMGSRPESGEALAMGAVVNTASRPQTSAPTGGLVVGDETYRATRHVIRYRELEPIDAKGKSEPVDAWLALAPIGAPAERPATNRPAGRSVAGAEPGRLHLGARRRRAPAPPGHPRRADRHRQVPDGCRDPLAGRGHGGESRQGALSPVRPDGLQSVLRAGPPGDRDLRDRRGVGRLGEAGRPGP